MSVITDTDIDYIEGQLEAVTQVPSKTWPPTVKQKHLYAAYQRLESFRTPVTPPAPPSSSKLFGIYLDPEGSPSSYLQEFKNAYSSLPNLDFGMLPLDKSVVDGVFAITGKPQVMLVPAGCTQARWNQYGAPAADGNVSHVVVVDEPGSDPASVSLIKSICSMVKVTSPSLKTVVTQFDPGTLTALGDDDLVDCLALDNYPARGGWNMATYNACIAACESLLAAGKISEFWAVLDAFTAPNYPAPTAAELLAQIQAALASNATRLIAYAWGTTGGTPLINLPGLISDLLMIP